MIIFYFSSSNFLVWVMFQLYGKYIHRERYSLTISDKLDITEIMFSFYFFFISL